MIIPHLLVAVIMGCCSGGATGSAGGRHLFLRTDAASKKATSFRHTCSFVCFLVYEVSESRTHAYTHVYSHQLMHAAIRTFICTFTHAFTRTYTYACTRAQNTPILPLIPALINTSTWIYLGWRWEVLFHCPLCCLICVKFTNLRLDHPSLPL